MDVASDKELFRLIDFDCWCTEVSEPWFQHYRGIELWAVSSDDAASPSSAIETDELPHKWWSLESFRNGLIHAYRLVSGGKYRKPPYLMGNTLKSNEWFESSCLFCFCRDVSPVQVALPYASKRLLSNPNPTLRPCTRLVQPSLHHIYIYIIL